jgi:hypothetical protein
MALKAATVYTFKVALAGHKSIWRRIAVRGSQTLDHLHEAIFTAFNRYDEHLYSFYFPGPGQRGRAALRDAVEYTHPYALGGPFGDDERKDASKAKLEALGLRAGQQFRYLFDFGDSWWHDITVEKIDNAGKPGKYPRVIEKHGASPPQYPDVDEEEG